VLITLHNLYSCPTGLSRFINLYFLSAKTKKKRNGKLKGQKRSIEWRLARSEKIVICGKVVFGGKIGRSIKNIKIQQSGDIGEEKILKEIIIFVKNVE
jgi:hypothetical protein